jgi:hypothetical protein
MASAFLADGICRVDADTIAGPTIGKTIEEKESGKGKDRKVWQRSKAPKNFVLHRMPDRLKVVFL